MTPEEKIWLEDYIENLPTGILASQELDREVDKRRTIPFLESETASPQPPNQEKLDDARKAVNIQTNAKQHTDGDGYVNGRNGSSNVPFSEHPSTRV